MDLFTSINPMETDSCQEACSRKQTKMAPSNHSNPVSTQVRSCHETRDQKKIGQLKETRGGGTFDRKIVKRVSQQNEAKQIKNKCC